MACWIRGAGDLDVSVYLRLLVYDGVGSTAGIGKENRHGNMYTAITHARTIEGPPCGTTFYDFGMGLGGQGGFCDGVGWAMYSYLLVMYSTRTES